MKQNEADQQGIEVSSLDSSVQEQMWQRNAVRWLRSWPGRITLSALTLLIILSSLVAMIMRATSDPLGAVELAFGGPTPTATPFIPPGGDEFGLNDWVPWGDLRIDGNTPKFVAITPIGQGFTLRRGVHHLVYQARYFPMLNCVITVPRAYSDTCPLASTDGIVGLTFQRIIDLQATPDRLRFDQYKLLLDSVESTLSYYSATTTIQPGERYINQSGQIEVAQTAMKFSLGVSQIQKQPDTACQLLCPIEMNPPGSIGPWYLGAQVSPVWTVADGSGQTFISSLTLREAPNQTMLAVTLDATGWSVAKPDNNLLDIFAQGAASEAAADKLGNYQNGAGWGATSGANPADGAVIYGSAQNGQPAILLWRFGILYVANAEAAKLFPTLPMANQQEQALARTMAAGIQS